MYGRKKGKREIKPHSARAPPMTYLTLTLPSPSQKEKKNRGPYYAQNNAKTHTHILKLRRPPAEKTEGRKEEKREMSEVKTVDGSEDGKDV